MGYFDRDDFVFPGKIGTGFDTKMLLEMRARLDKLEIPKSPFTKAIGLPRIRAHWVLPEIVVRVAFIEWTGHGKLRHPRLLGVRYDMKLLKIPDRFKTLLKISGWILSFSPLNPRLR